MMDFIQFARVHGVEIHNLCISDKIIRTGTTLHPKSKNGAYKFDGKFGWVQNWEQGDLTQIFGGEVREFSEAEKKEWARKKRLQEESIARDYQMAAKKAEAIIINGCTLKPHGYLSLKGFPEVNGFVTEDDALVIPMRSLTGSLQGIQTIKWIEESRQYEKKMLHGMKAKGAVIRLGSHRAQETILVEGYATGLSVQMAIARMRINACVLVCFSTVNLVEIAKSMNPRTTYIFADHDKSEAGEKCAVTTGLPFCMSDEIGDANDLHQSKGLTAVCKKIMEVRANR